MKIIEIPNFKDYFAGDDGEIYSNKSGKLYKLSKGVQSTGKYYTVHIDRGDMYKTMRVHRLIAFAFHGLPENEKMTCSHKDGNWKNNIPSNLCWETYSENLFRKKDHGTDDVGIKNSRAKITLDILIKIRKLLKSGVKTHEQIGKKFGLNRVFITKIANGYRYKGQGLI